MRPNHWVMALLLSGVILSVLGLANSSTNEPFLPGESPSPSPTQTEGEEAYEKVMAVLSHKRCVNCHPSGDRPRQGEDSHIHNFNVQRGPDNHGMAAVKCQTCHQEENNNLSGVPGAPEWHLAPLKMKWEGLTKAEIARSILNPENNGGRSLEEPVHHLTEHPLVLWAWEPGLDAAGNPREKPPVPVDEYIEAVKIWAAAGTPIPEN